MSKKHTDEELNKLISSSIKNVRDYLDQLKGSEDASHRKRAALIAYWLLDYIKYLRKEKDYRATVRYERGAIIQVNFGFRIGSELGGRHFAVVLDNYNSMKSNVVTVIPLSSLKENTKNGHYTYTLSTGLFSLADNRKKELISSCDKLIKELLRAENNSKVEINNKIKRVNKKIKSAEDLIKFTYTLKDGSVAMVGQITTISKQRIVNPKTSKDFLLGIKITPEDLNEIDNRIKYLYTLNE